MKQAAIEESQITCQSFARNVYEEHSDIVGLLKIQVIDLQPKLNVKVSDSTPFKPVSSFAPSTSNQSMDIPAFLNGRDVLRIAQTWSGENCSCSFNLSIQVYVIDQRVLPKGQGPIALFLVPTVVLAMQIHNEVKKNCNADYIHVVCAHGVGNKYKQSKVFKKGAEVVIARSGRLIDMIKMKVTNLERVMYLVLDEAGFMYDMGFEPNVESICEHARPDRLPSATVKKRLAQLASEVLTDPVTLVQGDVGVASENVTRVVMLVSLCGYNLQWLSKNLVQLMNLVYVIVFVRKKQNFEELAPNKKLKTEIFCRCLHGDAFQAVERSEFISALKKQEIHVLVTADVAARGLDIPHIRYVCQL